MLRNVLGSIYLLVNVLKTKLKLLIMMFYLFIFVFRSLREFQVSQIILWHYCLCHLSFLYLKQMFPSLFKNSKELSIIHCEICELAKHYCQSYLAHPYQPSHHFSLIHSDI